MCPRLKLLALETATDACSVALYVDGSVAQRHELAPQQHTRRVLPMVRELCAEAGLGLEQLDALAVGIGPGAFTGLRVAAAIAQGLAFAHELPVIPISTLAALAQGGYRVTGIRTQLATLDARRSELYWAIYEIDEHRGMRPANGPRVGPPAQLELPNAATWCAVGTGWPVYAAQIGAAATTREPTPLVYPEAQDVATLGAAEWRAGTRPPAAALAPCYLRAAL